jgi:deoxycytidine triphosphate deaminase
MAIVIVGTSQGYPFDKVKQVQPCSIDLRLGTRFLKFKDEVKQFDVKDLDNVWSYLESFEIPLGGKILLQPYQIIFGQIYEQLRIPPDCSVA